MLKVFFTFDTEIWCDGWDDIDAKFPRAYKQYVYGTTKHGDFAMPHILKILNDHGLAGVFFVEPLFAARFGLEPLRELVGLTQDAGQEVQLHLHTEWVDVALKPLLPNVTDKIRLLRHLSRADQASLLRTGLDLLREAGARSVNAFRAGNYAANLDTFNALRDVGLFINSSYNPASDVGVDDMTTGGLLTQPETIEGVDAYPVTAFRDRGPGSLRHLQLTACSFQEIAKVLNSAADTGWHSVVIVAHNFELLTPNKDRKDPIVVKRFAKLCRFLERNSDRFDVRGFSGLERLVSSHQPQPIRTPKLLTGVRFAEQFARLAFG